MSILLNVALIVAVIVLLKDNARLTGENTGLKRKYDAADRRAGMLYDKEMKRLKVVD